MEAILGLPRNPTESGTRALAPWDVDALHSMPMHASFGEGRASRIGRKEWNFLQDEIEQPALFGGAESAPTLADELASMLGGASGNERQKVDQLGV